METLFYSLCFLNGFLMGYLIWAPETAFKRGFMEGASLGLVTLYDKIRNKMKRST